MNTKWPFTPNKHVKEMVKLQISFGRRHMRTDVFMHAHAILSFHIFSCVIDFLLKIFH